MQPAGWLGGEFRAGAKALERARPLAGSNGDLRMIAVALLVLIVLLLIGTPWRRLPMTGRCWAAAALLNALIFFGMPTTPATSTWRPVVGRVLAASAGISLALLVLGLILRQRHSASGEVAGAWLGPLILGALPVVFYTFFWVIGPL
jgi:hypothetical protein